jgi:hypothetical protein
MPLACGSNKPPAMLAERNIRAGNDTCDRCRSTAHTFQQQC